jgi:hypothetical protein
MIVKGNIRKSLAGGYEEGMPARAWLELQKAAALLITPPPSIGIKRYDIMGLLF